MAARVDGEIRVLHVDDDVDFLEMASELLAASDPDISVTRERHPADALDRMETVPVDCLVTDYEMPGMDGLELLEAVRDRWPSMPVVLFTGQGSEEIASEAISAGVTDYLRKTGDSEQYDLLANRIRNAVSRHRAESDYEEIFERTADGIVLHDPETGRIVDANQRFCDILGRDLEAVVGMDIEDFTPDIPDISPDLGRRLVQEAATTGPRVFEWYGERPDGSIVPVEVHLKHTHIGGSDVVLGSVRDISERRETQRRLETIVANAHQAIYVKNCDGEYERINDAGVEAMGEDREEILGSTDADLLPPGEGERVDETDERVLGDGEEVTYEQRLETSGGEQFFRNHKFPLRDERGDIQGLVGISTDVTERKERERQLESQNRRIESLHDVAIDIEAADDRQRVYDLVVEAAEDILAFDMALLDEARGDTLHPVAVSSEMSDEGYYDTTDVDEDGNVAARAFREGEPSLDRDIRETEGAPADPEYLSGLTVPLDEYGVFQAVAADAGAFDENDLELTELLVSHAVQRLRQLDNEAELSARAEELRRQNDRLDEFTSIVSHDLRSPLNVALGKLELAREDCDSVHHDDLGETLERMDDIIEGSLTLAKQGKRVGDAAPVDLSALVDGCWGNVDSGEATLIVDSLPSVRADEGRLQHLFENLFRNAVDHGDGPVTVTAGSLTDDGDVTGFYVADDGPGIPEADREKVLEPGYSTRADGTGLGLAIVRWVAEAHGWNVAVTESADGGARFEVRGVELA